LRNRLWTWLASSKPTEWISSVGTVAGILTAIVSGFLLYSTGILDIKRSELETKRSELVMSTTKLEQREHELKERTARLDETLAKSQLALAEAEKKTAEAKAALTKYEREAEALTLFRAIPYPYVWGGKKGEYLDIKFAYNHTYDRRSLSVRLKRSDGGKAGPPALHPDWPKVVKALGDIPNLNSLAISGVAVSSADLRLFGSIPTLTSITIHNAGISNDTIGSLKPHHKMQSIDLANNNITRLPQEWRLPQLTSLDLEGNPLVDESFDRIDEAFPNVSKLGLADTKVTDKAIDRMLSAKQLGWVELNGTGVTAAGVLKLIRMPGRRAIAVDKEQMSEEVKKAAEAAQAEDRVYLGGRPKKAHSLYED
jgi:hypothetical protein